MHGNVPVRFGRGRLDSLVTKGLAAYLIAKEDYEYIRRGTANVFLLIGPLLGWRHREVTPHRGYREFAALMNALVDEPCPEAEVIRVVLDNRKLTSTGRRTRRSRRRRRGGSPDGGSSMTRPSTTVG
jgi:hypothetical protein